MMIKEKHDLRTPSKISQCLKLVQKQQQHQSRFIFGGSTSYRKVVRDDFHFTKVPRGQNGSCGFNHLYPALYLDFTAVLEPMEAKTYFVGIL